MKVDAAAYNGMDVKDSIKESIEHEPNDCIDSYIRVTNFSRLLWMQPCT